MTISGKYELLRPLSAAGFRSFHARHVITGQEVMVHFLGPGQRYEPRTATESSGVSPADARAQVLDAGTYEGTQFLVTYPVEDFSTLAEWLESVAPAKRSTVLPGSTPPRGTPMPVPPPPLTPRRTELAAAFQDVSPPRGPSTTSGLTKPGTASGSSGGSRETAGFTARFGGQLEPPDPRQQLQLPRQPAAPPSVPAPSSAQSTGSFTAVFGGPGNPAPVPQPLPAPSTRLPGSTSDSGSFSKMFGQPSAAARTPVPPTTSPSAREFNKIFLSEKRGSTLPPAPPELGRAQAPQGPPSQVGAFTDMFGGPGKRPLSSSAPTTDPIIPPPRAPMTAAPPRSAPPAYQPPPMQPAASPSAFDGATQIFGGPPLSARNAPPAPPPAPIGPGEFTMIMGSGPGSASPLAHQPSIPAPSPSPAAASGLAVPDFVNVRPPSFYAPQVSAPSVDGPAIGAGGFTPPNVRPPSFQAPSMAAPQLDFRAPAMNMPPMQMPPAAPAAPAGVAGAGSTFSPLLAALLSCVATVALLAIVYVLTKR